MGCIRVDKITEYLCEPLRKCLKDEDPYVRKTAAVCVAKLHDINAQMVEDQGFLDSLRDLIADSNPMVRYFWFNCPKCILPHSQLFTNIWFSLRLWLMQLLPCLRSASLTPTATFWTWILRTSISSWRPSTNALSGARSSSWTVSPTTAPKTSVRPRGEGIRILIVTGVVISTGVWSLWRVNDFILFIYTYIFFVSYVYQQDLNFSTGFVPFSQSYFIYILCSTFFIPS